MIGNFLSRGLVMILGYMYPAYECFKTVERNKPDIEQLRFWCQYWILIAVMTVFERVGDAFVSWLPFYGEAKLAFIIYLWYPKTKGSTFIYDSFFKPYVSKHETEIDRNLLELKTRAGDMAFMYCRKAVSCGQTRIFEILQYVATQSPLRPNPTQEEQQIPKARQAPKTKVQPQSQVDEPPSPTSSTSSSQQEDEQSSNPSPLKKSMSMQIPTGPAKAGKPTEMTDTTPEDTVMEEAIKATRGRLRKTRSIVTK